MPQKAFYTGKGAGVIAQVAFKCAVLYGAPRKLKHRSLPLRVWCWFSLFPGSRLSVVRGTGGFFLETALARCERTRMRYSSEILLPMQLLVKAASGHL